MSDTTTPWRIKASVWGVAVVFSAAVVLVSAALVWNARQVALKDSEAQATRFVAGAEAALNRSLLAVDVLLASMDELLDLSSALPAWIDPETASQRLRSSARQNLMVRYVAMLEASGKMLASSDTTGSGLSVQFSPGFVQSVLDQPVSTRMVSAPVVSFASAERVLYLARHLRMADSTRVVAVAALPVAALSSVLVQGVDIPGLQVTLERAGGQLLLSVPGRDERAPATLTPPLAEVVDKDTLWQVPARLSGAPALVVARPILYPDLYISASIPQRDALAGWLERSVGIALTGALFVVMILVACGLALRYLERHPGLLTVNLGTGRPVSVLEMVRAFEQASGRPVPYQVVPRRPGDVAACWADPTLAQQLLGWCAQHGVQRMCEDAWRWQNGEARTLKNAI